MNGGSIRPGVSNGGHMQANDRDEPASLFELSEAMLDAVAGGAGMRIDPDG